MAADGGWREQLVVPCTPTRQALHEGGPDRQSQPPQDQFPFRLNAPPLVFRTCSVGRACKTALNEPYSGREYQMAETQAPGLGAASSPPSFPSPDPQAVHSSLGNRGPLGSSSGHCFLLAVHLSVLSISLSSRDKGSPVSESGCAPPTPTKTQCPDRPLEGELPGPRLRTGHSGGPLSRRRRWDGGSQASR